MLGGRAGFVVLGAAIVRRRSPLAVNGLKFIQVDPWRCPLPHGVPLRRLPRDQHKERTEERLPAATRVGQVAAIALVKEQQLAQLVDCVNASPESE